MEWIMETIVVRLRIHRNTKAGFAMNIIFLSNKVKKKLSVYFHKLIIQNSVTFMQMVMQNAATDRPTWLLPEPCPQIEFT